MAESLMAALVADYYRLGDNCAEVAARVFLHQLPIAFAACTPTHPFALWLGMHTAEVRNLAARAGGKPDEFAFALAICKALDAAANKRAAAIQACADLVG